MCTYKDEWGLTRNVVTSTVLIDANGDPEVVDGTGVSRFVCFVVLLALFIDLLTDKVQPLSR